MYLPYNYSFDIGIRSAASAVLYVVEAVADDRSGLSLVGDNRGGSSVDVIIAKSQFGHEYLKTVADGELPNNLLNLPECPLK